MLNHYNIFSYFLWIVLEVRKIDFSCNIIIYCTKKFSTYQESYEDFVKNSSQRISFLVIQECAWVLGVGVLPHVGKKRGTENWTLKDRGKMEFGAKKIVLVLVDEKKYPKRSCSILRRSKKKRRHICNTQHRGSAVTESRCRRASGTQEQEYPPPLPLGTAAPATVRRESDPGIIGDHPGAGVPTR